MATKMAKKSPKKSAKSAPKRSTKVVPGQAARGTVKKAAAKVAPKGGSKIGRGTRWTEEQVALLIDTVKESKTAKEGFVVAADKLGKNVGTVQQKYYAVVRAAGGGRKRKPGTRKPGRAVGSKNTVRTGAVSTAARSVATPATLRTLSVDELVSLASHVKAEVDRRRKELDAASKLFG